MIRVPIEFRIAYEKFLSSIRVRVSKEKVEKVVKDPQKPTPNKNINLECMSEKIITPSRRLPITFIMKVPSGNFSEGIDMVAAYLNIAPNAPPVPMRNKTSNEGINICLG